MVYPGRPSHGCLACIARKVKCDEGKPECERCRKREQPCPGYRNPRDRKFVLVNKFRSAQSTNVPSTTSRPSSESSDSRQQKPESSASASQNPGVPIVPPHQNLCDQATCFFFHQYIIASSDGGNPGFLDFLPDMYEQSRPDDALAQAVKAISYIALSGKSTIKVLFARGHEHYRTTLNRITRMLESPEDTIQDSLIVAIMIVVLFENLTREKPAVMMAHAKGLHTLLLHRGETQFSSAQGWAIFRHVNAHTLVRNIELSEHPTPETARWLQEIDMSTPAAGSISEKYRVAEIRATAATALSLPHDAADLDVKLHEILQEAKEIDSEIALWAQGLPDSCQFHVWRLGANGVIEQIADLPVQDAQPADALPGFSESSKQHILTYTDVWFASLWHGYRTSRLMLNETIIRIARRLDLAPMAQDAITVMQNMCAESCASIPFSLGDVQVRTDETGREFLDMKIDSRTKRGAGAGAYFVVWSLRHVVSCEFASESQIETASQALVRIGAQFGVRQAFTLASRLYQCHPSTGMK